MKVAAKSRPYSQGARARSTEATAERIIEAFLARLMTQWFDEITLDRVAEDAGVTVQTVVRRFGGKEGLLAGSVKTLSAQINARRRAPVADVGQVIENLVRDYEVTGDPVIRLLALEPRHLALQEVLRFGRSEHRQWVAKAFTEALSTLEPSSRGRALNMLIVATDVYTWKVLRRDMARSVSETRATMQAMVHAVLAELSTAP